VLRRHVSLFDFLGRVAVAPERWLPRGPQREALLQQARAHWQTETLP